MYYTTSGAYRKSKMLIDYANIALTFAIGVVFIIILSFAAEAEYYLLWNSCLEH